jgi:hypothetical protein
LTVSFEIEHPDDMAGGKMNLNLLVSTHLRNMD